MTKLKIVIFTYAYIKHSNSISTCQNCKSEGLCFCHKIVFQMTKKIDIFLFRSCDQKYAEQKKNKKTYFFTSPEDGMYITVSGVIVFAIK